MKALVYTGQNTLELREMPDPEPAPGEVLVRVEAVGICGSDMHAYHGHDGRRPPPLILGHEAAGTIASGAGAGRRVAVNPLVVDPACPYAMEGRWHLSPTRQIISMPPRPGAFAELFAIPERNVVPIPDDMSIQHAALAEPVAVAFHAVRIGMERLHAPLACCRVIVLGGGAIGLAAALVAQRFGARNVRVAETNPLRRTTLSAADLRNFEPSSDEGAEHDTADLVIDAVGAVATRQVASRMVRPGGVIVHVGLLPGHEGFDIRKITLHEICLTGSYCYTPRDFTQTVEMLDSGALGSLGWFAERPLADGSAAFRDIDAGVEKAAKIILRP